MITTNTLLIGGSSILLGAALAVLIIRYYNKQGKGAASAPIIPFLSITNFLELLKGTIQKHHIGDNNKLAAILMTKSSAQQEKCAKIFSHTSADKCILFAVYNVEEGKIVQILHIVYYEQLDDAVKEMFTDGILIAD